MYVLNGKLIVNVCLCVILILFVGMVMVYECIVFMMWLSVVDDVVCVVWWSDDGECEGTIVGARRLKLKVMDIWFEWLIGVVCFLIDIVMVSVNVCC